MKIKQTLIALALVVGIGGFFISPVVSADCGGIKTSIINCDGVQGQNGIWQLLNIAISILTAGIGVAAVGGIVYGAILYTTAGGSVDQTKKAKTMIFNVAIGLVAYALMLSFLNFIIPGGVKIL